MLTKEQVQDLVDFLDNDECAIIVCNGTLKLTKKWIEENGLQDSEEEIIAFLEEYGGYCDCEVVMNVAQHFE